MMTKGEEKIRVENVSKLFGNRTGEALSLVEAGMNKAQILEKTNCVIGLSKIDLSIAAGETFVIMGLSGSGKSTLIRHFNRLIEPTTGKIFIDGQNILELNKKELVQFRRHKISMVFQRFGLLPHQTVLNNVIYGLKLRGVPKSKALDLGMAQLELVNLKGFENRYPSELSGGMQQRVGLARALATESDILLMDEAFSALDPLIKADMQQQLKEIQKSLKKTIVFITHDLDEALFLGDRIAILKDGELRQVGNKDDILFRPADEYVSRFINKVDYARAVTGGSVARKAETIAETEIDTAKCRSLIDTDGAVFIRSKDGSLRILRSGSQPVKVECIDSSKPIREFFGLACEAEVIGVEKDGVAQGYVSRQSIFSALRGIH